MSYDPYEVPMIPGETRAERKRHLKESLMPIKMIRAPKRGPNRKMRRKKEKNK